MSFTIYFAIIALMNIFLGYFLAMRLGLVVPGVSGASKASGTDADWEASEDSDDSGED